MLINTLPLLEAQASSEIENIVTTADKLFQYLRAEALRYRHALLEAFGTLKTRPLCTRTAELVCSRIRNARAPDDGPRSPTDGRRSIPRDRLANWERFLHGLDGADELDPLVRMAAAHYQFEAIHPFTDGNGRTGRV
jgi:Fic family protein